MQSRKFFAKVVQNWPAKVLSIGLAILLFVFHQMSILEEQFFSVPLKIENLNAFMSPGSYPRLVRVSLRGEANSIHQILGEDIEVYVDLGEFNEPGTYTVPVRWRKKGAAYGVRPLQITVDPREINISLRRTWEAYP